MYHFESLLGHHQPKFLSAHSSEMTDTTSQLRPYYRPETFHAPRSLDDHGNSVYLTSYVSSNSTNELNAFRPSDNIPHPSGGDFDYVIDLEVHSSENITKLGHSMLSLYSKVTISQPFEVTRMLLQAGDWKTAKRATPKTPRVREIIDNDSESDEEADYFTSTSDLTGKGARKSDRLTGGGQETAPDDSKAVISYKRQWKEQGFSETIDPNTSRVMDVLSALNLKDGLRGLWRGMQTTFLLDALTTTLESWISGFLSAVIGIPDPLFVEPLHSPSPIVSLAVGTAASVLTALILSPIDIIRTKFIMTTFHSGPRSFRQSIVRLKSFTSPVLVLIPTVLYSGLPSLIQRGTPYYLHAQFNIDSYKNPTWFNTLSLISSFLEISVKLPLETMVRRAQLASLDLRKEQLIVAPAPYHGILGSLWNVLVGNEQAESYFRGWRIAATGVVGEWGVQALQNDGKTKERF